MHVFLKRILNLDIPIDLHLYLFDHVILPIALYGCEIWGFEHSQIIENLHNDFLRQIINLKLIINLSNFETIRGSLMKPKWQKLASLA